jgi:uncharacterized FAD-dependent dehydrogenase
MIRISDIKLDINQSQSDIKPAICRRLRIDESDLLSYNIYKQSVDARKRNKIYFVYTVDVELREEEQIWAKLNDKKIRKTPDLEYNYVNKGSQTLENPPIIVGTGPAGLFAGLMLAQMGYSPILIERGKPVDERIKDVERFITQRQLNPESNIQFGEGGAGTFSDGKLYTSIKDKRCRKVLEELITAGAPEDILYRWKPHIGTDILRNVVKNLRKTIISLGGQIYFQNKLTDILIENGKIVGIEVDDSEIIRTDVLILAIGHSARDTFEMLQTNNVPLEPKPFSIGVRIEHPQKMIDHAQYGKFAGHPQLGSAEYKLAHHLKNGRSIYTFCMCPGGFVIPATSEKGCVVTNGMSEYARDRVNANSAILVGITPQDFGNEQPLSGIYFQRKYERKAFEVAGRNYDAPVQLVEDFLNNRSSTSLGNITPSYKPDFTLTDLSECLPDYVINALQNGIKAFDRKIKGFARGDAVLTGVETRSSCPVRILRDKSNESEIKGLYPTGEGAGYAGGIVSAAVDGIKSAEAVAKQYSTG